MKPAVSQAQEIISDGKRRSSLRRVLGNNDFTGPVYILFGEGYDVMVPVGGRNGQYFPGNGRLYNYNIQGRGALDVIRTPEEFIGERMKEHAEGFATDSEQIKGVLDGTQKVVRVCEEDGLTVYRNSNFRR